MLMTNGSLRKIKIVAEVPLEHSLQSIIIDLENQFRSLFESNRFTHVYCIAKILQKGIVLKKDHTITDLKYGILALMF